MPRPFGVTLVGILVILAGISYVLTGILAIFNAEMRASVGLLSIIVVLVLGLIYLAVAKGLFDGNSFSRFLVGIVTVVALLFGIFQLIFISGARWNGLFSAIFSLIILGLLFSRKATLFFTAR
jgi:hypothetical protein